MAKTIKGIKIEIDGSTTGLVKSLEDVNKKTGTLQSELRQVERALKFNPGNVELVAQKQKLLADQVEATSEKLKRLKNAQADVDKQFAEGKISEKAYREFQREIVETESKLKHFESQLATSQSKLKAFGDSAVEAGNKMKSAGDGIKDIGKNLSMKVTAPIVAVGGLATKAAIDFESAFAGMRKTIDASEEEFAALEKGVREMAKELPATASEIAAVGEAAGQLGIKKENILDFTRTMINLGEATNLTADEAATQFARFANIVQMPQENFDKLGSSVVALGNSMATTEAEIVSMGMRLSGTGAQIGLTEAEIMALAASMSSVGIEAEAGGTAMSMVMKKMQNAISLAATGSKNDLKGFADTAGMTSGEFAEAFETRPIEAIDAFIKGLARAGGEGENLNAILDNVNIKGIREADTMLRLAGASELLGDAVNLSTQAWNENSALADEAAQRYATTESQLSMFKNTITDLGITIGTIIVPALIAVVDAVKPWVERFAEMDQSAQTFIVVLAGIAAAIGPLLVVIGTIVASLGALFVAFGTVSGAMAVVTTGAAAATPAVGALAATFTALTGPIGITVAAIAGVVAALVLAYNKVDWFREGVNKVWESIKSATKTAFDAISKVVTSIVKDVVEFASEQLNRFKLFWDENGKAIMAIVKGYLTFILDNIKLVMGLIKGVFEVVWPIISGIIKVAWGVIKSVVSQGINLVLGIIQTVLKLLQGDWQGAWDTIKATAVKIVGNIVKFFQDVDLLQIGKDMIQGLINGIGSMVDAVVERVKSLAKLIPDWIKDVLGIKSPSRVMMAIGKDTGEGLAVGIDSTRAANEKAVLGVAKVLSNAARKNAEEVSKIAEEAEKKRTEIQQDYAKKRADLRVKSKKSTSAQLIKLNEDEQKKLSAVNEKAWADMVKKENEISKERLEAVKTYVSDKKSMDELSLVAEAEVWRKSLALFNEGTKERVEIQKGYQAALKAINDEVTKTNEEYAGKMQKINETLRAEEKKLTDEYEKTLTDRTKALINFSNTFDFFEVKLDKSSEDLMNNLRSQVFAFERWQQEIDEISKKAIDKGLIEELKAMGPKALPELIMLNSMTDKQLSEYSDLYSKKSKLAREQAEKELIGMKSDTERRIKDLRTTANTELEALRSEWVKKIQSITNATDTELKSLKQIGVNAGQGLLDGLASMERSLVDTARSIANAVSREMEKALKVKSPSRVTMKIGEHVGEGLMVGMENMLNDIKRVAGRMGEFAVPSMPNIHAGSVTGGGRGAGAPSSSAITLHQENHFHSVKPSPSEDARLQKRALEEAALAWR